MNDQDQALATKRHTDEQAAAEALLSRAVFDRSLGVVVAQGLRLAVAQAPAPEDKATPRRAVRIAETLERLWGVAAAVVPSPDVPTSDAPDEVLVRVQVTDRTALFEQAKAAYLRSGGGEEAGVINFLGTADEPVLANCITEILADADKDGAMDFPG